MHRWALIALGALAACDDQRLAGVVDSGVGVDLASGDLAVTLPRNFDEINQTVLFPYCANFSGCHSPDGHESGLDLETDPYRALVGAPAMNKAAAARGLARVMPCDVDRSFLWIKLTLSMTPANQVLHYGANMPLDSGGLAPPQLDGIRAWIERGARRDEPGDASGGACELSDASIAQ